MNSLRENYIRIEQLNCFRCEQLPGSLNGLCRHFIRDYGLKDNLSISKLDYVYEYATF